MTYQDRSSRREVTTEADGAYSAGNPFQTFNWATCANSPKTQALDVTIPAIPGVGSIDWGRAYAKHQDGNAVFAVFGRSLHIHEHTRVAVVFLYTWQALDWWSLPPARRVRAELTADPGGPAETTYVASVKPTTSGTLGNGYTYVDITSATNMIRSGDELVLRYDSNPDPSLGSELGEGGLPLAGGGIGPMRAVTLDAFDPTRATTRLPLLTGSAGRRHRHRGGSRATHLAGRVYHSQWPTYAQPFVPIRSYTAYGPVKFLKSAGGLIELVQGHSGYVSFSDKLGRPHLD